MSAGGWVFMLASVGSVVVLTVWCFRRVLSLPPAGDDLDPPPGS